MCPFFQEKFHLYSRVSKKKNIDLKNKNWTAGHGTGDHVVFMANLQPKIVQIVSNNAGKGNVKPKLNCLNSSDSLTSLRWACQVYPVMQELSLLLSGKCTWNHQTTPFQPTSSNVSAAHNSPGDAARSRNYIVYPCCFYTQLLEIGQSCWPDEDNKC